MVTNYGVTSTGWILLLGEDSSSFFSSYKVKAFYIIDLHKFCSVGFLSL